MTMKDYVVTTVGRLCGDDLGKRVAFTTALGEPINGYLTYFSADYHRADSEVMCVLVDASLEQYTLETGFSLGKGHEIQVDL